MITEKSRSWFATIQEGNMKNAGLSKEDMMNPEYVAKFFKDVWENSAKGRKACVSTCVSENGLYHLHAALYGQPTTAKAVAKCMYDSHVEPTASKKDLLPYINN